MQGSSHLGREWCCSGCTLQTPARVGSTCGSHTSWLQRQGSCNPAKPRNGKAAKLGLADDCSHLSNIKVALILTKALCSAPVQNQNDDSPFQNIYWLIKRHDTRWIERDKEMIFSSGYGRKNVLCPVKLAENYIGRVVHFVLPLLLVISLNNILSCDLHQWGQSLLFPDCSMASRL